MKRRIFIGSSSEGLEIANQVKNQINAQLGNWIACETWQDGKVFSLNRNTLESLVKASRKYDYGILVASKDDVLFKRMKFFKVMRENVMFEMGLFLGSLGLQRAFLITHDKVSLPSDFDGVTVVKYNTDNLNNKISAIISEIENTKNSFNLKPVPSAALALGYFQNFIIPFAEKLYKSIPDFKFKVLIPLSIADVNAQILRYQIVNPSNVTDGDRPKAYKYENRDKEYWDIPTTLQTIDNLLDYFVPSMEIGINLEKKEWIHFELRNFKGTLEMLIQQQDVYKNNISVEYL